MANQKAADHLYSDEVINLLLSRKSYLMSDAVLDIDDEKKVE